ncbi:MAG: hypothetical protein L0177_15940 [Chloroflexi bacterium]|nr:hypothetical protein [Chloroflexota bacterium]
MERLRFDSAAYGQPQEWVIHHRGLEYMGEVIVAEGFDYAWGQPLGDHIAFRVVFVKENRRIQPSRILDRRIAAAVLSRRPEDAEQSLGRELRAIRETIARYSASDAPGELAMRDPMRQQEAALLDQLERRYASAFAGGRVYTHDGRRGSPPGIFVEGDLESWADNLASFVLSAAFSSLPFAAEVLPALLTEESALALFEGLFQAGQVSPDVLAYGLALGLVSSKPPHAFDASECPLIPIIRREAESRGGEASGYVIFRLLTAEHGLTRPLALLYLLAFVRQERAALELVREHRVLDRAGNRFVAGQLTWDLVPELDFATLTPDALGLLRLQPSIDWDTALPYAALLADGLQPNSDAPVAEQEGRLLAALSELASEIAGVLDSLAAMRSGAGGESVSELQTLYRLQSLCAAASYQEFYTAAQEGFQGPGALESALDGYRRLRQLAALVPAISQTRQYLDSMTFGRGHDGLLFERDALAAMLDWRALARNPALWSSIAVTFERLRARYASAYADHHEAYRQEALELRHRLERLQPQIEALAKFNEIAELGQPVGNDVPQLLKDVTSALKTCPLRGQGLALEKSPSCQSCLLSLDDAIPRMEAETLFGAVERAMREYNRRLGSHGVRHVLAHPTREQLDKFIGLVQLADPSALANVLDDEVIAFLRQFLRNRPTSFTAEGAESAENG